MIVLPLVLATVVGVASYVIAKSLATWHCVEELHRLYTAVDDTGKPLGYRVDPETVNEIVKELRGHIRDDETHNRQLQSKMADILMIENEILVKLDLLCRPQKK